MQRFVYEHQSKKLLSRRAFFHRMLQHGEFVLMVIATSLVVGVAGYHWLAQLPWVDAFLNACMIMGGMGPVDPLKSDAAKIFAALYALYSGLMLLVSVGVLFAPVLHRILHRFHLETKTEEKEN